MNGADNTVKIEVCAVSLRSVLTAEECGASRVELCDNMAAGGTTPSCGVISEARKLLRRAELYVMIRPRGGAFLYTDHEFEAMKRDVECCGELGCDGVVFGILHLDGSVDTGRCAALVSLARRHGMGVTFHRAFDEAADRTCALEEIIGLGFDRVLTSGGAATAPEGIGELKRLVELAGGRISVMAGSGVTPANAVEILRRTGCREIHGTFSGEYPSGTESPRPAWSCHEERHADPRKVAAVVEAARRLTAVKE